MSDADRKLEADIGEIFSKLTGSMLPDTPVESIHSYDIAEDGALIVLLDMTDGSTGIIRVCAGERVHCSVVS